MSWQDIVNGSYEMLGAPFILLSIINLYKCKQVRGVTWWHPAFFGTWSLWNLYYYPHLGQWFSFFGGILISLTTCVWLGMMLYYIRKEKQDLKELTKEI